MSRAGAGFSLDIFQLRLVESPRQSRDTEVSCGLAQGTVTSQSRAQRHGLPLGRSWSPRASTLPSGKWGRLCLWPRSLEYRGGVPGPGPRGCHQPQDSRVTRWLLGWVLAPQEARRGLLPCVQGWHECSGWLGGLSRPGTHLASTRCLAGREHVAQGRAIPTAVLSCAGHLSLDFSPPGGSHLRILTSVTSAKALL